ncbi:hypothetical protein QMK38_00710 [Lysinibacillus fusiformis]|nr:hypothetical protein [Lysinibacillus fusiformis]
MNKYLLSIAAFSFLLTGCGDKEESKDDAKDTATTEEEKNDESINVDKGLLNVEITLPATFFEEQTEEQIIAGAKEEGYDDVKVNEDGSVTYKMSKAKHTEMMDELEGEMVKSVEEIVKSGDYPSIKEISYNKSFDEYDVKVEREQYENSLDGFALLGLVMTSSYYQAFDGKDADKMTITFNMIDNETNESYDTLIYPDDWEDEEEETTTE